MRAMTSGSNGQPAHLMTIGEIARRSGFSIRTLRFYERRGVLPPTARRPSGYRLYGDVELRRLAFIRQAKALGLTLEAIRELLMSARQLNGNRMRQGYGRIVLTTSGRAMHLAGAAPGLVAYSIGKMAQLGLMVGLAAETRNVGIRINAISPVAVTRVLRRSAPDLLPEHVAPAVVFLAFPLCNFSGVVLRAAGGRFSTAWWCFSNGVDFGPVPVELEVIAERWLDISKQT